MKAYLFSMHVAVIAESQEDAQAKMAQHVNETYDVDETTSTLVVREKQPEKPAKPTYPSVGSHVMN
jgi:hypothetical protein